MNERPGEHEPGYPPAPAPRTEPYSVDDVAERDGGEQPDRAAADEGWSPEGASGSGATDAGARTGHGGARTDTGARPAEGGLPWAAGPQAGDGARPAGGGLPWTGGGLRSDDDAHQALGGAPAPGDRSWQNAILAGGHGAAPGAPGRDRGGLPWSAPDPTQPAPDSYPPSAPPAEYASGGHTAATGADVPYAWREQPPQPAWQRPGGYPPPPQGGPATDRRRRGPRRVGAGVVVLLVLVALLGGIVLGALGARWLWPSTTSDALPAANRPASTARAPESVAGIAAAALESTVFIEVLGGNAASSGSGMVLREDGYLVTNNHVIASAADQDGRVNVTFADGSQERADIVGRTADYDLAVLRVDRDGLTPLPLADSDAVAVGDPVVAVGAPLGLEGTVTSGIISALNRPVQAGGSGEGTSFINAIQTDAAINPGNSGGPLINTAGEVIGINTAIAQASGQPTGSIGLGFSIPSNQVRRTAEQIIETGQATYPVIGVALDTRYQGEGVQVLEDDAADTPAVTPGGPGDEAGIEPGDVITHFDGQPVTTPSELIVAVRSRAPGDTVVLTVRSDGGQEREVEVVLDEAGSE